MNAKLVILSPVVEGSVDHALPLAKVHRRGRYRMATVANGKPRAAALIEGVVARLRSNTLVESVDTFSKPGASFGLSPQTLRSIEVGHDLVLNGVGD